MNLKITRHSTYRRLDRIEAHARRAQQRLLHRALAEIDTYLLNNGQRRRMPVNGQTRSEGFQYALGWAAKAHFGYGWADLRQQIMLGAFGSRLARLVRRAESLDDVIERVAEEYGTREGESAADCAAWSADRAARADWECRHMERWTGD